MQYVAAVSGKGWEVDRVKEQLLQSNPVLEGTYVLRISVFCILDPCMLGPFFLSFFFLRTPLFLPFRY